MNGGGIGSGGGGLDPAAARRRRPRPAQAQYPQHPTGIGIAAAARQSVLDANGDIAASASREYRGARDYARTSSPSRGVAYGSSTAGQDTGSNGYGCQGGGGSHIRSVSNESSSVPFLTIVPSSTSMSDSSPGGRGLGGAKTSGANVSNIWKRTMLCIIVSFLVVWMTIMTLLVAKLASEQQQQQQGVMGDGGIGSSNGGNGGINSVQSTLPIGGGGGATAITGGGRSISDRVDHGSHDALHGLGSFWRQLSCGWQCWGRTYSYTDVHSGDITVASLEHVSGPDGGGNTAHSDGGSGSGGEKGQHWPRGPIFYATPSMLPYMAQTSTASLSSSSTAAAATTTRRAALQAQWQKHGVLDPMLRVAPGEEAAPQDHDREPHVQGDCVPMQPWQVMSFPNCNAFHELNMIGSGRNASVDNDRHGTRATRGGGGGSDGGSSSTYKFREDNIDFLGRGWFRAAWKVDSGIHESDPVVLKTLRLEREFYDEYYELHRKDAVAMERLTPSPYVIDIYGYCGQSAINELADFFTDFTNLQAFARQLQGNNDAHMLRLKLQISIMMTLGVAHMHEIDGPNNATMVHYDINPKNVAIVKGGKPKLNDFNTVEFLRWNKVKQKRCGFRGRLHEPWWRAPEELVMPRSYAEGKNFTSRAGLVATMEDQPLLDEKIDVWSLGNLLYNMLTGHAARGQARTWRYAQVRNDVLNAKLPWRDMDAFYLNSTQPAIVAMRRAVERCIVKDPKLRRSALDVAYEMMDALEEILAGEPGNDGGDAANDSNSATTSSTAPVNTIIEDSDNITSSPVRREVAGSKEAPQSKSRNSTRQERHRRHRRHPVGRANKNSTRKGDAEIS